MMMMMLCGRGRRWRPGGLARPCGVRRRRQAVPDAAAAGLAVLPGAGAAWVGVAAAVGGQDAVVLAWVPLEEVLQGGVVRDSLGFFERGLSRGGRPGYNQTRNRSSTTSGWRGAGGVPGARGRGWVGRRGGREGGGGCVGSPGRSGRGLCSRRPGRAGGVAGVGAVPPRTMWQRPDSTAAAPEAPCKHI